MVTPDLLIKKSWDHLPRIIKIVVWESIFHLPPSFHLYCFLVRLFQQCLPRTSPFIDYLLHHNLLTPHHDLWLIVNISDDETSVIDPQLLTRPFLALESIFASGFKRKMIRLRLILQKEARYRWILIAPKTTVKESEEKKGESFNKRNDALRHLLLIDNELYGNLWKEWEMVRFKWWRR